LLIGQSDIDKPISIECCSAFLYGNWADLIIGIGCALDVMADPYTGGTSGTVRVVALEDVDIAVRHAQSFALMADARTI